MKEYEKLAQDNMKKAYGTDTMVCDYYSGFLDGFLKAREMAVDYMETTGEPYFALDKLGEKEI